MLKFKMSVIILGITLLFSTHLVSAKEYHRRGFSKDLYPVTKNVTQEQYFKNFMIELLHNDIIKAVQTRYKDKKINGLAFDWDTYNAVEINTLRQNVNGRGYSYQVSVTVTPHTADSKKQKIYGTDKLTFGIEPILIKRRVKDHPAIELIDYQHLKPSKNP
jgi:hypothetical protein